MPQATSNNIIKYGRVNLRAGIAECPVRLEYAKLALEEFIGIGLGGVWQTGTGTNPVYQKRRL